MKTYYGIKEQGVCRVRVVDDAQDAAAYDLAPRPELFTRVETPFNWGDQGAGTSHLALALLADVLDKADRPRIRSSFPFMRRFLAHLSVDGFEITETIFRALIWAASGSERGGIVPAGPVPERLTAVRSRRDAGDAFPPDEGL